MIKKIILVGYMAAGKTTIGKKLAQNLGIIFLDLDALIEKKEGKTINELFHQKGELYFRKLEHQLFKSLIDNAESFVLSTGGGTPCYSNNHLFLDKSNVVSIYLDASIQTVFDRLIVEKKQRPIVKDLDEKELKEFIAKHLFERSYYYQKAMHKIKIDQKEVKVICAEIAALLL
jgi:shikimate kinase